MHDNMVRIYWAVPGRPGTRSSLDGMRSPLLLLAGAVLPSLADLLADGQAPSWLVRVGPFLSGHFPARNLSLCLGRPGLLLEELGRRLRAFFPGPAAKETHGVMVDRRLANSAPFAAVRGDPYAPRDRVRQTCALRARCTPGAWRPRCKAARGRWRRHGGG